MAQSKLLTKEGRKKQPKRKVKRKLSDPYPFDEWFDALNADPPHVITLERGKHFPCRTSSMVVQLRMASAAYGIKICVNVEDDDHLVMRKRQVFGGK